MVNNELYHYGILGMKWGVRRYQSRDGTLTNAGKKRYNKEMAKLKKEEIILKNKKKTQAKMDKLNAKKKSIEDLKNGSDNKTKPKSVKDYSDDELRTIVNRMQLEQRYKELSPKKVSKGKAFVNRVVKNVVAPAAEEVGKQYLKSLLNNMADNKKK